MVDPEGRGSRPMLGSWSSSTSSGGSHSSCSEPRSGSSVATAAAPGSPILLPVASFALLTVFVFGEDDYRDNGTSRWDAYSSPGGAIHALYVLSVVGCGLLAGLLAFDGLSGRRVLARTAAISQWAP